jgi:hypothetical protein
MHTNPEKQFSSNPLAAMIVAATFSGRPLGFVGRLALGVCMAGSLAAAPVGEWPKGDLETLGGVSFTLHVEPRVDDNGAAVPITPTQVDQAMALRYEVARL